MPCRDDIADAEIRRKNYRTANRLSAAMCGILTVLEKSKKLESTLNTVDWKEAGTSKERLLKWWEKHKKQDAERRAREKEEADNRKRAARLSAKPWKTLTQDERNFVLQWGEK